VSQASTDADDPNDDDDDEEGFEDDGDYGFAAAAALSNDALDDALPRGPAGAGSGTAPSAPAMIAPAAAAVGSPTSELISGWYLVDKHAHTPGGTRHGGRGGGRSLHPGGAATRSPRDAEVVKRTALLLELVKGTVGEAEWRQVGLGNKIYGSDALFFLPGF
jgi:hypothetical protein